MTARGRRRIAKLASGGAKVSIADGTAYVASEARVVRVAESLARDLLRCGVSVFSIDHAQVDTRMHEFLARSPRVVPTPVERTGATEIRAQNLYMLSVQR